MHAYRDHHDAFVCPHALSNEAKPEWIQQVPGLDGYQNMLIEKAKFLAEAVGRGRRLNVMTFECF